MEVRVMTDTPHTKETCYICDFGNSELIQSHHVIPRRKNGLDADHNLVSACPTCHEALENIYDDEFWRTVEYLFSADWMDIAADLQYELADLYDDPDDKQDALERAEEFSKKAVKTRATQMHGEKRINDLLFWSTNKDRHDMYRESVYGDSDYNADGHRHRITGYSPPDGWFSCPDCSSENVGVWTTYPRKMGFECRDCEAATPVPPREFSDGEVKHPL